MHSNYLTNQKGLHGANCKSSTIHYVTKASLTFSTVSWKLIIRFW